MADITEILEKERRVREMMAREGLDAVALSTTANFAWFTGGSSNYVGLVTEAGVATIVITEEDKYIVCENIEAPRIVNEEVGDQDFEFRICHWYESRKNDLIMEIAGGGELGSDVPMEGARYIAPLMDPLRANLTEPEIERYKLVGKMTGECLSLTARQIEPGMTEHEIAGILAGHVVTRGMVPTVNLIATDERISLYRHPIPMDKKLDRTAMLVIGARKWGLVVSATRMVHFGEIDSELRRKHDAVALIDATLISNTRPGAVMGDIFSKAGDTYASTGFTEEWKLHHQGGSTGYKGRDIRVTPETKAVVVENQAFAWNPSITGTKTEDTIIANSSGHTIISETDEWPKVNIEIGGTIIQRPDILIR